ncbi:uncharacterized protein JCM6883_001931 [Sporobolomyces salmoneus]|uniref:uncharacterized protein n=1 Tax=Sporobolomyces salmoneus TaxID=183962 RepID=UPI0031789FCA
MASNAELGDYSRRVKEDHRRHKGINDPSWRNEETGNNSIKLPTRPPPIHASSSRKQQPNLGNVQRGRSVSVPNPFVPRPRDGKPEKSGVWWKNPDLAPTAEETVGNIANWLDKTERKDEEVPRPTEGLSEGLSETGGPDPEFFRKRALEAHPVKEYYEDTFPIQEMHWPPPEDTQQPSDWPPPQTWTSRVPSVNLPARVVQTTNPYRVQAASYRMPVTVKSPRPSYPSIAPSRATSGGLQVAQPYNIQQMVYEQQLQPNRLQRRPGAPDDGGWGCGGGDC